MRLTHHLALLLVLALPPAWLAARFHPELRAGPRPPLAPHEVDLATALAWGGAVLWLDVRAPAAYRRGHLPGAQALAPEEWETRLPDLLERWRPGRKVVVYCDHRACDLSRQLAARLRAEAGLPEVYFLRGGWESWETRPR